MQHVDRSRKQHGGNYTTVNYIDTQLFTDNERGCIENKLLAKFSCSRLLKILPSPSSSRRSSAIATARLPAQPRRGTVPRYQLRNANILLFVHYTIHIEIEESILSTTLLVRENINTPSFLIPVLHQHRQTWSRIQREYWDCHWEDFWWRRMVC